MMIISPPKYSSGPSPTTFDLFAMESKWILPSSLPFHITFLISPVICTFPVIHCPSTKALKKRIFNGMSKNIAFIFSLE